ncbi:MAG TPA: 50S ribosomal protein L11 methyltransferase [Spirochaetota bacterium]|nr:50S ribosomal protein L11 methyltransferase [Spirochaetota bacterium]
MNNAIKIPESLPLLSLYMKQYGALAPDPLCPELRVWNTFDLTGLWQTAYESDRNAPVPFWAIIWPGGRALARFILDNRKLFSGKRVLDVGTGSGITAVAAAKAGAKVTGMDIDRAAVALAEITARENKVKCSFIEQDPFTMTSDEIREYDIILAGDLFYSESLAASSISFFRSAAGAGVDNYVSDGGRTFRPTKGFRILRAMRVPVFKEIEGVSERDVKIMAIETV